MNFPRLNIVLQGKTEGLVSLYTNYLIIMLSEVLTIKLPCFKFILSLKTVAHINQVPVLHSNSLSDIPLLPRAHRFAV
jgi:hypothetical protein